MELQDIIGLISDYDKLRKEIEAEKPKIEHTKLKNQYNTREHDVFSKTARPDKLVETDNGPAMVPVARIGIPYQKKIVALASTFLCGNPVKLDSQPVDELQRDLLAVLTKSWNDNKLRYDSLQICEHLFSETEVAELWYVEAVEPDYWKGTPIEGARFRLRMRILAPSEGDGLYPVFNRIGDMVAFGREYKMKEGQKEREHFDLYTDSTIYSGVKTDTGWSVTSAANTIKKIPVVYYTQPQTDWADVQEAIDRMEKLISNHGDSNDYFGSPMVFVQGEVEGFAKKGEQGKVLIGKAGAKAEYLTWNQAPESIKLEFTNLQAIIHDMTDTPNISFEMMKGLGTFSGIALKMLFLGAHMKASKHEANVGRGFQRRINFMKAAMAVINIKLEKALNLVVEPLFEYYLPKNALEIIEMLSTATGGKPVMSTRTAVIQNPLVQNPEEEMKLIEREGLNSEFVE